MLIEWKCVKSLRWKPYGSDIRVVIINKTVD